MWLAALLALVGEVDGSCPTPAEVQARVVALGGSDAGRVQLTRAAGALEVRLLDDDGAALAMRRLDAKGASCDDLADAAAVVVSGWMDELPATPVVLRPPALEVDLGATISETAAPGASLTVRYALAGGLTLGGGAAVDVEPVGSKKPTRVPLWVQGGLAATHGLVRGEIHLDAMTAVSRQQGLAFGVGVGTRFAIGRGPFGPWLGLGACWWPGTPITSSPVDILLTGGLFYRFL